MCACNSTLASTTAHAWCKNRACPRCCVGAPDHCRNFDRMRVVLRFLTAGESHGQALVVIVEGVPAGLALSAADLAPDLARRQLGYGRGRRMSIEQDRAEILSGVRRGETMGGPIALTIRNRDWSNW